MVCSYKVKLPDNTRHPSCTKLPCPRLLHPHPAGGELEKFRERLYRTSSYIPAQKTSIYSNNTEAYSNQFSTSRFVEQSFSKLLHAAIPQIFLESRCFVSFHTQQPRCRCRPSPEHLGFGDFGPRDAGIFSLRYCQ